MFFDVLAAVIAFLLFMAIGITILYFLASSGDSDTLKDILKTIGWRK